MTVLSATAWLVSASLELGEVQRSATTHFPSIRAAIADVRSAEAEALAARGGFDPLWVSRLNADPLGYYNSIRFDSQIDQPTPFYGTSFFAGYRIGRGDTPDYKGGLLTNDYGELRAGVSVPLVRNGWTDRRRATVQRAELSVEGTVAQQEQTRLEVVRAASFRYLAWAGAGLRQRLAQQMLDLATARDAQIEIRVKSGDAPQFERIDNQRSIAQRQAALVQAIRASQQTTIDLSLYYRSEEGSPVRVESERLPQTLATPSRVGLDEKTLTDQALSRRPDLTRQRVSVEQAGVELSLQKNQLLPALDVRVMGSQDLGPGSSSRKPFELEVGVLLDVPLAFRFQRGRVDAARAQEERAQAQLQLQRDRIVAEVQDAYSALVAAIDRHEAAEREAVLAVQVAALEAQRLLLGESTVLTVNLRETSALEAQQRVIDTAIDAHRALIELQAVTATL